MIMGGFDGVEGSDEAGEQGEWAARAWILRANEEPAGTRTTTPAPSLVPPYDVTSKIETFFQLRCRVHSYDMV